MRGRPQTLARPLCRAHATRWGHRPSLPGPGVGAARQHGNSQAHGSPQPTAVSWGQLLLHGGWSHSEAGAAMSPQGQQSSLGPVEGRTRQRALHPILPALWGQRGRARGQREHAEGWRAPGVGLAGADQRRPGPRRPRALRPPASHPFDADPFGGRPPATA